jgi:hypothetical protein
VYQQKNKYALDLYKAWEAADNRLRDDLAKQKENEFKREDLRLRREQQRDRQVEQRRQFEERQTAAREKKAATDKGTYAGHEGQRKAILYGGMLDRGNRNIQRMIDQGYFPSTVELIAMDRLDRKKADRGLIGGAWDTVTSVWANESLSPQAQQFYQAAAEFKTGVLRPETGAAYAQTELSDVINRYIPKPGDSPEVRQQKKEAREEKRIETWIGSGLADQAWGLENAREVTSGRALLPAPPDNVVEEAMAAIKRGVSREQVLQLLRSNGYRVPQGL